VGRTRTLDRRVNEDAYKQTEFTTPSIKGACVEWPWLQKNERILISIPVPQVRDFIQPKSTVDSKFFIVIPVVE
jgi:hypothetical protein